MLGTGCPQWDLRRIDASPLPKGSSAATPTITGSVIDYRTMLPDVVIMDIAMPGLSDIETTRRLLAGHPNIKVLALCTGLIWS